MTAIEYSGDDNALLIVDPYNHKAKEINLLRREIASLIRIAMPLRSRIYEIYERM